MQMSSVGMQMSEGMLLAMDIIGSERVDGVREEDE